MKLKVTSQYKSLKHVGFEVDSLPDVVVLTGKNGSGKTHVLESIQNKQTIIEHEDEQLHDFIYFNYQDFILRRFDMNNPGQLLKPIIKNQEPGFNEAWKEYKHFEKESLNIFHEVFSKSGFYTQPIISYLHNIFFNLVELNLSNFIAAAGSAKVQFELNISQERQLKKDIKLFFEKLTSLHNFDDLVEIMKRNNASISRLQHQHFLYLEDYFGYRVQSEIREYRKAQTNFWFQETLQKNNQPNSAITQNEFVEKLGVPPWDLLNEILEKYGCNNYFISEADMPVQQLNQLDQHFQFDLVLRNNNGDSVSIDELSSGEKTLFALAIAIYSQRKNYNFPRVLLLDEIDANLHPSMVKQLLTVIKELFVSKYGMKVFLATHSPSTIAFSPDDSIYIVDKNDEALIQKTSKNDALSILTEGFITLKEGLELLDEISSSELVIVSEGHNIKYIEKILKLYSIDTKKVRVLKGIESNSGSSILKTLFQFFSHVPHKSKVLFVWDCDEIRSIDCLTESNETFKFAFEKNKVNDKVTDGIENLFPKRLFKKGFYDAKIKGDGGSYSKLNKNKFMEYILDQDDKKLFTKFKPLADKIDCILKA